MHFSEAWLKEWVSPPCNDDGLIEKFEQSGFELETLQTIALALSQVVVGKVIQCSPHPLANRLKIAYVQVSDTQTLQIICGAPNCRSGIYVACALVGAQLPSLARPIERIILKNTESLGMLCSASELGLGTDESSSAGILELSSALKIGTPLTELLLTHDRILSLGITPNRGDCLSIFGLARETAALFDLPFETVAHQHPLFSTVSPIHPTVPAAPAIQGIEHFATHCCTRRIEQIQVNTPTPLWIQQRLKKARIRIINLCVDILNYVMLELGQPMHAYDANAIMGKLHARYGTPEETLQLLNGTTLKLVNDKSVIIADERGALSLAGILGASRACVSNNTNTIIIEAAGFFPTAICQTVQEYNLNTEASARFERGIDPAITRLAIERATHLILECSPSAKIGEIHMTGSHALPQRRTSIPLHLSLIHKLLGVPIPADVVEKRLRNCGFAMATDSPGVWSVGVPTWRVDINLAEDLCDCLAKLIGYDSIPAVMPAFAPVSGQKHDLIRSSEEKMHFAERIKTYLVAQGYFEAITFGFCDGSKQAEIFGQSNDCDLPNPISANLNTLRLTPLPALLQLIHRNQCRRHMNVRCFELGKGFTRLRDASESVDTSVPVEEDKLTICCATAQVPLHWRASSGRLEDDFFSFKGMLEGLCVVLGLDLTELYCQNLVESKLAPYLHPTQAAKIAYRQTTIGYIGTMHPKLTDQLDLKGSILIAELNVSKLQVCQEKTRSVRPISKYPLIRRDFSFVVDAALEAQSVVTVCADALRQFDLRSEAKLIDCYLPSVTDDTLFGKKGLTVALCFQCLSRALSHEEINQVTNSVLETVRQIFVGIELRTTLSGTQV